MMRGALYAASAAGGRTRCLTPENTADDTKPRYSPDSRSILYGLKRDPLNYADRVRLALLDRASGRTTILTEGGDRSCSAWEWLDPRTVAVEVEDRGRITICMLAVDELGREPATLHADGSLHLSRAARGRPFVTQESLRAPPEAACLSVAGGTLQPLTHFNDEALSAFSLSDWEELELAGAGADAVHTFVVYPPGFSAERKWPLLQLIHGGPLGMFGDA